MVGALCRVGGGWERLERVGADCWGSLTGSGWKGGRPAALGRSAEHLLSILSFPPCPAPRLWAEAENWVLGRERGGKNRLGVP